MPIPAGQEALGGDVMPSMPLELGPSGVAMYKSLLHGREVSAAHKALVLNAARLADRLDSLSEAIDGRLTTTNSLGTESVNPLISEHRVMCAALTSVLSKLGVSELPRVTGGEKSIKDQMAEQRAKREARTG